MFPASGKDPETRKGLGLHGPLGHEHFVTFLTLPVKNHCGSTPKQLHTAPLNPGYRTVSALVRLQALVSPFRVDQNIDLPSHRPSLTQKVCIENICKRTCLFHRRPHFSFRKRPTQILKSLSVGFMKNPVASTLDLSLRLDQPHYRYQNTTPFRKRKDLVLNFFSDGSRHRIIITNFAARS